MNTLIERYAVKIKTCLTDPWVTVFNTNELGAAIMRRDNEHDDNGNWSCVFDRHTGTIVHDDDFTDGLASQPS